MKSASTSPARHILLVEPDREQSARLALLLQTEGYTTDEASTLEEAMTQIEEYPYDLVLTDLFVTRPPPRLDAARRLQDRCQPTPVGILTAWPLDPDEARRDGFVFLLPKPVDPDALLERIATVLSPPFTPERAQHVHLVQRYLYALGIGDWDVLRTLCTPDVGYYPLTGSLSTLAREITGIDAYLTHAQEVRHRLPDVRLERAVIFAQTDDVVARYRASWQGPAGGRQSISGFVICRFRGERIFQIGVTLRPPRREKLLDPPQEPPGAAGAS